MGNTTRNVVEQTRLLVHQIWAMLVKNWLLQMRSYITNTIQIVVPLILILFAGVMQLVINQVEPKSDPHFIQSPPMPLNMVPFNSTDQDLFYQRYWTSTPPELSHIVGYLHQNGTSSGPGTLLGQFQQYKFTPKNKTSSVGGDLPMKPDPAAHWSVPFVSDYFSNSTTMRSELRSALNRLRFTSRQNFLHNDTLYYSLPDATIAFDRVSISDGHPALNFSMAVNMDSFFLRKGCGNKASCSSIVRSRLLAELELGFGKLVLPDKQIVAAIQPFSFWQMPSHFSVMDILGGAMFPFAVSFLLPNFLGTVVSEKETKLKEMMKMMGLSSSIYWALTYVSFIIFFFLVAGLFFVTEILLGVQFFRESGILLNVSSFFLFGNCMIGMAFMISPFFSRSRIAAVFGYVALFCVMITAEILNAQVYLAANPPIIYWLFPPFSFYRAIYLMFMECIDRVCVTDTVFWSRLFSGAIFSQPDISRDPLRLLITGDLGDDVYFGIFLALASMLIQIPCMFALAWYLLNVIPAEFSIRKSLLFPILDPIQALIRGVKRVTRKWRASKDFRDDASYHLRIEPVIDDEDEDVVAERDRVASLLRRHQGLSYASSGTDPLESGPDTPPLIISNLSKIYSGSGQSVWSRLKRGFSNLVEKIKALRTSASRSAESRLSGTFDGTSSSISVASGTSQPQGPKYALQSVSFALDNAECFGLLGPNGAGKTTLISVVTGLFPATSGIAIINGWDIARDVSEVQRIIGVCPQHDILWEKMTVREHLTFCARVKGVPILEQRQHVSMLIEQVGLQDVANRLAVRLSGGMKRRLSLAIALVANPRVVILDEPTTGLDPEARRLVWEAIMRAKQNRSIVLTTHNLEEADVLCNRIGIMADGRLRCIGTQLHLKKKHGEGYRISIAFNPQDRNRAVQYVLERTLAGCASARVAQEFPGLVVIAVSSLELRISHVFESLEQGRIRPGTAPVADGGEACIRDWSLSQTSLEDVFTRVVLQSASFVNSDG